MLIDEPIPDPNQLTFLFDANAPAAEEGGIQSWRAEREAGVRALAKKSGLPLEHTVELTLLSGPVLRGRLRLAVESLWIEAEKVEQIVFEVDGATFRVREIESCVRED